MGFKKSDVTLLVKTIKVVAKQNHYKSAGLSVSEWVLLFVCSLTLRNGEPQRAQILRDDSFGIGKILGIKKSGPLAGK